MLVSLVLLCLMSACSSDSSEPEFAVEGEWIVSERWFECSDETIEKYVNDRLKRNEAKDIQYKLTFSEGAYEEEIGEKGNDLEVVKLKGSYVANEDNKSIDVSLENIRVAWDFSLSLIEPNLEHMFAVKQEMNSSDIEKFYEVYFGLSRDIDEDVTAILITKAVRIK